MMAYQVQWCIENFVLFTTYSGKMSVQEFIEVNTLKLSYVESSPERVHLIADMRSLDSVEPSVSELSSVIKVLGHERVDWVIGIGMSQMQSMMLKMIGYVFRKRIYSATSKAAD